MPTLRAADSVKRIGIDVVRDAGYTVALPDHRWSTCCHQQTVRLRFHSYGFAARLLQEVNLP